MELIIGFIMFVGALGVFVLVVMPRIERHLQANLDRQNARTDAVNRHPARSGNVTRIRRG
jgi:hypothetical protein